MPEWVEVENTMRAMIKLKRVAQSSINWEDKPEAFIAFEKRSLYMAGFIQGAEWMLNDISAALQEEPQLQADIKTTEDEIKEGKQRG